jgi:hypothetical protein
VPYQLEGLDLAISIVGIVVNGSLDTEIWIRVARRGIPGSRFLTHDFGHQISCWDDSSEASSEHGECAASGHDEVTGGQQNTGQ